ncbi:hypothetical protein SS50377_24845 [Spironucleus salmonicida]|nr:hypothetical protein SS50377_24830 [Spironucleus salmonicida]KAH0572732.1 hypothetical protein SS50377_24845 [Spironucleus salmonicida]|eukprot:EST46829.1 hypothetical protein SS50377_13159 [Spironucleus salmonicida]
MLIYTNCNCAQKTYSAVAEFLSQKVTFNKCDKVDCDFLVDDSVSVYHAPSIIFYMMRKAEQLPQSEAKVAVFDCYLQCVYSLLQYLCAFTSNDKLVAARLEKDLACINEGLSSTTFIADKKSAADIFVAYALNQIFGKYVAEKNAKKYSHIVRYVATVCCPIAYKK